MGREARIHPRTAGRYTNEASSDDWFMTTPAKVTREHRELAVRACDFWPHTPEADRASREWAETGQAAETARGALNMKLEKSVAQAIADAEARGEQRGREAAAICAELSTLTMMNDGSVRQAPREEVPPHEVTAKAALDAASYYLWHAGVRAVRLWKREEVVQTEDGRATAGHTLYEAYQRAAGGKLTP